MKVPRVVFVLPVRGGGGGANSVVQESLGLARLGVDVRIAVNAGNHNHFVTSYSELQGCVRVESYLPDGLASVLTDCDVAVATTNDSVHELRNALSGLAEGARPKAAYYVQDYEPLFYLPDSPEWLAARDSYTAIPGMHLFAKTRWLQRIVYENHGIRVHKVEPSIDHDLFFPDLSRPAGILSVVAMVRPKTVRRAPARTIRIMDALIGRYSTRLAVQIFGASDEGIAAAGLDLCPGVTNRGVLRRTEVPNLLRNADLFLDLSDYQAFGRSGLEAMASGCVPVVPVMGGADEYAVHGFNAYVVDTRSDQEILAAVDTFVELSPAAQLHMRMRGLETASRYTIKRAALSELQLFSGAVST